MLAFNVAPCNNRLNNWGIMKKHITKYDYIDSIPCLRRFAYNWFASSGTENGPNPVKDFLTRQGQVVGVLAQQLFRGIAGISFEQTITCENLITRPDVLDLKKCELIEIKSTTETKEEHLLDVGFQKFVCDKAQVKIDKVKIGHINKHYERSGDVDVKELFQIEDVTDQVLLLLPLIDKNLRLMNTILAEGALPPQTIGPHCFSSEGCPFKKECWGEAIDDSILTLRRDQKGKRFELHANSVRSLKDIPDFVTLTKFQTLQKEAETHNCAIIDHRAITEAIHEITYPAFFLDFETFLTAIPLYPKTTSYQQIPFQASVHQQKKRGGKLKHFSFLHTEATDPRISLAQFLVETLGEYGSIIVYHGSFEKGRIYELIKLAPHFEQELLALIDRIWDLEEVFDKGMYVHPKFAGSTSIKKVLPVLCPELSYDELEINNGQLAFIKYLEMISPDTSKEEKEKIKTNLEAYCTQDTYAMYAILKKLLEVL